MFDKLTPRQRAAFGDHLVKADGDVGARIRELDRRMRGIGSGPELFRLWEKQNQLYDIKFELSDLWLTLSGGAS